MPATQNTWQPSLPRSAERVCGAVSIGPQPERILGMSTGNMGQDRKARRGLGIKMGRRYPIILTYLNDG
jgi:hypothetical protein